MSLSPQQNKSVVFAVCVRVVRPTDLLAPSGPCPVRAIVRNQSETRTPQGCAEVAHRIAAQVEQIVPGAWLTEGLAEFDFDLDNALERLKAITPDLYPGEDVDQRIDDLNECLAALYDWADDRRSQLTV